MGQKSLDFSINKCIPTQLPSDLKQLAYKANRTSAKCAADRQDEESSTTQPQRRFTTEELSRWVQRLSKAKITFRKQHDLRREVLVQNANLFAQSEIKFRQMERQKRWKEIKPLLVLEDSSPFVNKKMAAPPSKMADNTIEMADVRDLEMVRPDTPVPALGYKRSLCGCSSSSNVCLCKVGELENSHNKRVRSCTSDDYDDLKSLDCFLASLHSNSRQTG